MKFDDVKFAQRERLVFLDRCLIWRGAANRRDLVERFAISSAQAAIDFRVYLSLARVPPIYDAVRKTYVTSAGHEPLVPSNPAADFDVLSDAKERVSATVPQPNRSADPSIISRLYGAIKLSKAIHVCYTSMTTGLDEGQWLAPTRFTSDGENIHLRAYSFKHQSYRDYLPIRVSGGSTFEERSLMEPLPTDYDWHTRARLWLRPKPDLSEAQAAVVRQEYGFEDEFLVVDVRKAMEFYLRRRWRLGDEAARLDVARVEYTDDAY